MKQSIFSLLPPFYVQPLYDDVQIYLKQIEEEFPIKIKAYRYFKDAFDHDVFVINKEIVFRFPRTESESRVLQNEIEFLKFLKDKVDISIPQYKYFAKKHDFAGYTYILGSWLTASTFESLSKTKKTQVIEQLINFVNVIHKIDLNTFSKYEPRVRKDFITDEKQVEKELADKLFPKLPSDEVQLIKDFYIDAKNYFVDISSICATHGDLYAYNTIFDKKSGKLGVIDFSDLLIGDPAKDFEVFYDYGPEYAQMAYQQYVGVKDKNFLKRGEIYYKLHAIYTLLSSQLGSLMTFNHAYKRFKQKFGLL